MRKWREKDEERGRRRKEESLPRFMPCIPLVMEEERWRARRRMKMQANGILILFRKDIPDLIPLRSDLVFSMSSYQY